MKKRHLFSIVIMAFFVTTAATCQQQEDPVDISPADLKVKLENGKGVLLDVRRPDEVNKGVIDPSMMHYNFQDGDFKERIAQLDKKETYYVYCHAGGRSAKAVQIMKEMGFKKVYNVDGGITKWQEAGYELVDKK